tara:strand:- start:225 stop:338 length:114 start_codon:yes stop_codon:yes gene_type:complete
MILILKANPKDEWKMIILGRLNEEGNKIMKGKYNIKK